MARCQPRGPVSPVRMPAARRYGVDVTSPRRPAPPRRPPVVVKSPRRFMSARPAISGCSACSDASAGRSCAGWDVHAPAGPGRDSAQAMRRSLLRTGPPTDPSSVAALKNLWPGAPGRTCVRMSKKRQSGGWSTHALSATSSGESLLTPKRSGLQESQGGPAFEPQGHGAGLGVCGFAAARRWSTPIRRLGSGRRWPSGRGKR